MLTFNVLYHFSQIGMDCQPFLNDCARLIFLHPFGDEGHIEIQTTYARIKRQDPQRIALDASTAIDREHLTRDKRGLLCTEKIGGRGDILRRSRA